MVIPPAALIDKEEEEKNLAEKLHANVQAERPEFDGRVGGEGEEEEEEGKNPPLRYVSLCDVYSATSPCVSSASGGSKKVKPPNHQHRKSLGHFSGNDHLPSKPFQLSLSEVMSSNINANSNSGLNKPPITHYYSRRYKGKRKRNHEEDEEGKNEDSNADVCHEVEKQGFEEANGELIHMRRKKRKSGEHEGLNLGVGNSTSIDIDMVGLKEAQNTVGVGNGARNKNSVVEIGSCNNNSRETKRQKNTADSENNVKQSGPLQKKKWVWCDSWLFYLFVLFGNLV